MDFEIVKFYFDLPQEQTKMYEMTVWAQKSGYDYDVDYEINEQKTVTGAIMYIVFDKKDFFNYKK